MTATHDSAHRPTLSRSVDAEEAPAPRKRRSPGVWASAFLIVVAVIFASRFPITNRQILVQIEQYALIAYSAARAVACLSRERANYATVGVWLFIYTLFGLVQTVQLSRGQNPFLVPAPDSLISEQLLLILVGAVAFDATSTWASHHADAHQAEQRAERRLSLRSTAVISWLLVLASPVFVARAGGLHSLFSSRLSLQLTLENGAATLTPFQVITLSLANVAPFLCLFSLVVLRSAKVFTFSARPDLAVLIVLLGALNFAFNNPISQPRFWIATILIASAVSGRWVMRGGFKLMYVVVFVSMSVLVFPYLDVFRYNDPGQARLDTRSIVDIYLNKTDYASAQDIVNTVEYVQQHGHTDGKQVLGDALFFVPRSAWPNKPSDTAKLLAIDIGYANQNIDSPLWAEGYIDFGVSGVILYLAIFGLLCGRADAWFRRGTRGLTVNWLLAPVFTGYELILLRGSLLQAMGRLSMVLVLCYLLSSRRPTRSSPVQETHRVDLA